MHMRCNVSFRANEEGLGTIVEVGIYGRLSIGGFGSSIFPRLLYHGSFRLRSSAHSYSLRYLLVFPLGHDLSIRRTWVCSCASFSLCSKISQCFSCAGYHKASRLSFRWPAFLDGSRIPAIWVSVLLAPLGGQDTGPSFFFFKTRGRSQGDYSSCSVTFDLQASWEG
jgi:hypothetical protein